jgi:hypothetical protein
LQLGESPQDDEDDDAHDDEREKNNQLDLTKGSLSNNLKDIYQSVLDQLQGIFKLPQSLQESLSMWMVKLQQFQTIILSFAAGAILAMAVILVPIYSQVETLNQPVTLFETILSDLEMAYVDKVDTNKLFETGVSAMLRSLDPYTEFESAKEATAMTESIVGRYAGVGLVITGTDQKTMERVKESGGVTDIQSSEQDLTGGSDISSVEKSSEIAKAFAKQSKGTRVVSAFEGYAYDYGLRVGDKLVAIDDIPIGPDATVESVSTRLRGEPGTTVSISFERVGVDGVQRVSMPRTVVRMR